MHQPWNNWFHCTCNTFGIWLPGDSRGWDTRHHRQHIANVPATISRAFHELPSRRMVRLPRSIRLPLLTEFVSASQQHDIEVIIASLDDHHLHVLARIRDHECRHWLGIAKKHTSHWLRQSGQAFDGGIWAKRSRALPILNRQHQINVYRCIFAHRDDGAAFWQLASKQTNSIDTAVRRPADQSSLGR